MFYKHVCITFQPTLLHSTYCIRTHIKSSRKTKSCTQLPNDFREGYEWFDHSWGTWLFMKALNTSSSISDITTRPLIAFLRLSIEEWISFKSLLKRSTSCSKTVVSDGKRPLSSLWNVIIMFSKYSNGKKYLITVFDSRSFLLDLHFDQDTTTEYKKGRKWVCWWIFEVLKKV